MKPTYQVKVWPDHDWWLARVVDASDDSDRAPLNALTQARSLAKVDPMARDLIATILDEDEEAFDVDCAYELPDDVNELVCQARGARVWADAAHEMWQEQSTMAAKALTGKGYSLRETATLLGLSHQRVDQLVGSPPEREMQYKVWMFEAQDLVDETQGALGLWRRSAIKDLHAANLLFVLLSEGFSSPSSTFKHERISPKYWDKLRALLVAMAPDTREIIDADDADLVDTE
jgi:hypothetical protein